jgi:hypothetical protein
MKRMAASNVLIVGVQGLGVEIGASETSKPDTLRLTITI